jgi:hypothetical protein
VLLLGSPLLAGLGLRPALDGTALTRLCLRQQEYMPEGVQTQPYYEPTDHGAEKAIKERLEALREEPTPPA